MQSRSLSSFLFIAREGDAQSSARDIVPESVCTDTPPVATTRNLARDLPVPSVCSSRQCSSIARLAHAFPYLATSISIQVHRVTSLGGSAPKLGKAVPGLGNAVPGLGNADPGLGNADPGLGNAVQGLGNAVPKLGKADPGFRTSISS